MRNGKRSQRLGNNLPGICKHRKFSAPGTDDLAVHKDEVAQVDICLPGVERFLADAVEADHHLQVGAVTFLKCREAELSGVAGKHHPARNADELAGLGVGLQVWICLADLGKRVGAGDLDRVGLTALGEQPFPLGLTDPELLGDVGLEFGLIR